MVSSRPRLSTRRNRRGFSISLRLGIDLGGTKLALALADAEGRLLARQRRPTASSGNAETDLARIAEEARELVSGAGAELADVEAVGVSVPGPIDVERGLLLQPPNLPGWREVPVRRLLEDALACPVFVENDANAAALAEWRHGSGSGARHVVYLTMSTGVGAGLILDGRLYGGKAGSAGELGHTVVEWGGDLCGCGNRGCLEAYCGGACWMQRLRSVTPEDSRVATLAGGRANARPEHVVAAAREGDAFARAEFDRYNHYLARGIVNLAFALAPEVVILGTIPTHAGDELCFDPVREQVAATLWPSLAEGLRIVPASLADDLPYYAGVCVAEPRHAG